MKKQNSQSGFTLIELLVVVAILSLLASTLMVSLNGARKKSRDAKRVADINQISKALEFYYEKHGYYPQFESDDVVNNWNTLIPLLSSEKILSENQVKAEDGFVLIKRVLAVSYPTMPKARVQDPQYPASYESWLPTQAYGYQASANNGFQSYRIRTRLEDVNHPALQYGLSGMFQSGFYTTGHKACDKSLGYYCVGTPGNFVVPQI